MKHTLTIAGSDSGGGAGIQADLKTFSALGTYGMSVITSVTAQNTMGVQDVFDLPPEIIGSQLDAIFTDIRVDAVKVGMVSVIQNIEVIAERLRRYKPVHLVIDPVMVSKNGCPLLQPSAVETMIKELFPLAEILTPNVEEARVIADRDIKTLDEAQAAARMIQAMGPKSVLIKGGHLEGEPIDCLFDGEEFTLFHGRRLQNNNTHGTGCTLSSAIASHLAIGYPLKESVRRSKEYVATAIQHGIALGHGIGPTHHFYELYQKAGLMAQK